MDGLLTLLIFALLFFLMMRFGCGAHMMHGSHGNHGAHSHDASPGKDPVCGMVVPDDSGYRKAHEGHTYRFCSRNCLDKFDREPNQYLSQTDIKESP